MSQPSDHLYEFGPYRVDGVKRLLLRDGQPVPVTSKVFDTLLVLIQRSGQVLQKDELMKALWPDTIVEENNLTQQISMLRKALGERAGDHRYVVTVPGRGYSFVASVREVWGNRPEPVPEEQRPGSQVSSNAEEEAKSHHSSAIDAPRRPRMRMALAVAVLALFVGLGVLVSYRWIEGKVRQSAATGTLGRSIAVLPFKDLSTRSSDNSLGTGLTDTLIARLSNIRQISVRPTSAVLKYAGENWDARAAGRELGVDAVLEGTVQRSGDRVRVTAQLVSVRDGSALWAQSFDDSFTDIFAMQDSISEQIARAVLLKLGGDNE
jgi:TolB-like protein/DNA-binding winged helix-turn-helix (wHTH) protein